MAWHRVSEFKPRRLPAAAAPETAPQLPEE